MEAVLEAITPMLVMFYWTSVHELPKSVGQPLGVHFGFGHTARLLEAVVMCGFPKFKGIGSAYFVHHLLPMLHELVA